MILFLILFLLVFIIIIFFYTFYHKEDFLAGLSQLYIDEKPFTYIIPKKKKIYKGYQSRKFNDYFFYYPWGYYPAYYPL